jgi:hypothetical protein
MPATLSPMLMPTRTGGRSVVPGGWFGEVAQAAHRFADHAEGGAVALRPVLAVAGDARDHQVGPRRAQGRFAEAQLLQLARAEVLHQRVAPRGEAQRQLPRARLLQVQRDAALVPAVDGPPGGVALVAARPTAAPGRRRPGGSTLMTSAPRSPSSRVQKGAATKCPSSRTRRPASGPDPGGRGAGSALSVTGIVVAPLSRR